MLKRSGSNISDGLREEWTPWLKSMVWKIGFEHTDERSGAWQADWLARLMKDGHAKFYSGNLCPVLAVGPGAPN